ncbi:MAG: VanW family protein [Oscillospiraceae bacterium]|nr:VanW family protein [Oscillospiraceae bacterium]
MKRVFILLLILALIQPLIPATAYADDRPLYQGTATTNVTIRSEPDINAKRLAYYNADDTVIILSVDLEWLYVKKDNIKGYVPRRLVEVTKQFSEDDPRYGAMNVRHAATLLRDAPLYSSPSTSAATLVNLPKDARVAILSIRDGWAQLLYNRQYGYLYASHIKDLEPVSASARDAKPGSLIAAFQTSYNTAQTDLNNGRMTNISVACQYMNGQTIDPGASVSFNEWIGPFSLKRGFQIAPVLINGTSMPGSGGGTCQVSTTLYNALLELKGISILHRRAHGPSGAAYVPHGTDAAVGSSSLDLVFRNDFDFPITMQTWAGDGVLFISIYKG